jgi:hypothetical protein
MIDDLYFEKLNWFRRNEKPEVVLVIADNPELIRIVVSWANLDVRCCESLTDLSGESDSTIWEWLWENAIYSLKELKEKSGVVYAESVLADRMKPLIGNRVLYPDGTVNSFVQRYLRERVLRLFEPTRPIKKRRE